MSVATFGAGAMQSVEELRTPRLLLSRPRPHDAEDYVRMYADPVVMATLGGVRTPAQTRELFDRLLGHWDEHGFGLWIAREPASGRFVGRGGLRRQTLESGGEVEVAYGLMA